MFCRSLFVLLYLLFWPFCCMFFLDIQILITLWYLQTLIKVQRSMFDRNDLRYYETLPLYCLSYFNCIVCHPSIVSTERNQRLKIVRGMAIDLPSFFLPPKINYSTGLIILNHFVTCSAISYSNDYQHMLPRKWYQGQRTFETLTLDP